jgi:hypothetical protein
MADNLDVTAGVGSTIRMVEKAAKKSQVVVLDIGGAGAESLLTTTLPVSLAALPALVASAAVIGITRDGGPCWTSVFGVAGEAVALADMTLGAMVTDNPTAGQKIVIVDVLVASIVDNWVLFSEETTLDELFSIAVPAYGTVQFTPRGFMKLSTADKQLIATTDNVGGVSITVTYFSEP